MKPAGLDRLLELRRHREEKALETVTMRERAHSAAKTRLDEARDAVVQHAASAKARERELMAGALGQSLSQSAFARIQANLDVMVMRRKELLQRVEAAERELNEKRKELDKARAVYRQLQKEAEKLGELIQLHKSRSLRRQLSLNEAIEEEQTGATGYSERTF